MRKRILLVIILVVLFTIYGSRHEITYWKNTINSYYKDQCSEIKYKSDSINIKILDYSDLPYVNKQKSISYNEIYDFDSVPLFCLNEKLIYHPVYLAQYSFRLLDVYNTTKDSSKLVRGEIIANKLLGISIYANSSIYFPYNVDYKNHNDKFQKLYAPWYSGMAQGQILSLFVRLYEITKKEKYLNACDKIFNSFTKLKGDNYNPWTVCVDKENYFWIEEYPSERPCFTINGMIFGIYGVYDYYRITKCSIAKRILMASLTTVKKNIYKYRNKNDISYYCQEENLKLIDYHTIVTEQFLQLFKITGDKFFLNVAIQLKSDTKNCK